MLRNLANPYVKNPVGAPVGLPKPKPKPQEREAPDRLGHTFDGKTVHGMIGNFQLCDISDPSLYKLIHAPEAVHEVCSADSKEGWYKPGFLDQIRAVLKLRFMAVHGGHEVTEADYQDLLGDPTPQPKKKSGRPRKSTAAAPAVERSEERESSAVAPSESEVMEVDAEDQAESAEPVDEPAQEQAALPTQSSAPAVARRKSLRVPWEERKRKQVGPRKPTESEEQRAQRLREAIEGLGGEDGPQPAPE